MEYDASRRTVVTAAALVSAGIAGCLGLGDEQRADGTEAAETGVNDDERTNSDGAAASSTRFPSTSRAERTGPAAVDLKAAQGYAVLAAGDVAAVGAQDVGGNLGTGSGRASAVAGLDAESSRTGQSSAVEGVDGDVHAASHVPSTPSLVEDAVADAAAALDDAASRSPEVTASGERPVDGAILDPGTYRFPDGLVVGADLTLDGGPADTWILQVDGDLVVDGDACVAVDGEARPDSVVWIVAGATTVGPGATLAGTVLSAGDAALLSDATIDGRLLAGGDVGLQRATVTGDSGRLRVETRPAEAVEPPSATVGGRLTHRPGGGAVAVAVEYRELGADEWRVAGETTRESTGAFEAALDGVETGTGYEFRAAAETDERRAVGAIRPVVAFAPADPAVRTRAATDVGGASVTLNAVVTALGDRDRVPVAFQYRPVGAGDDAWTEIGGETMTQPGPVDATATGLESGGEYEFRALAALDGRAVYGPTRTVALPDAEPNVVTWPATDVHGSAATLSGSVTDLAGRDAVAVGFEHRPAGTSADAWAETGRETLTEPGRVDLTVGGFDPGAEYEFRATARTVGGTVSGTTRRFAGPESDDPAVRTGPATNVMRSSARLSGSVTDLAGADSVSGGFEYRPVGAGDDAWTATARTTLAEAGPVDATVEGLPADVGHEFRIVVEGGGDAVRGPVRPVGDDEAGAPRVVTRPPTRVDDETATVSGVVTAPGDSGDVEAFFEVRATDETEWTATTPRRRSEPGTVVETVDSLRSEASYRVRAVAEADGERAVGSTLAVPEPDADGPTVRTRAPRDPGGAEATLVGEVTDLAGADSVTVRFECGEDGTLDRTPTRAVTLTEPGEFAVAVGDLEVGRRYRYRAVVEREERRIVGEPSVFATQRHWQVDFGPGLAPPNPPYYNEDGRDVMAALGNSIDGVAQDPSLGPTDRYGGFDDLDVHTDSFMFDDPSDPTEATVRFELDEDAELRELHLASFVLPGPYSFDEVDDQRLYDAESGRYEGGDRGRLTVSLPRPGAGGHSERGGSEER